MSMHKIELTDLERQGLKLHGLAIGTPSQSSDCFRNGIKWALENTRTQSQCELYDELYKAALGLSHGVDWNKGTHAIEHGYRDKLLNAVMKLKEQGQ